MVEIEVAEVAPLGGPLPYLLLPQFTSGCQGEPAALTMWVKKLWERVAESLDGEDVTESDTLDQTQQ